MITISLIWINVVISGFIPVSEYELWGMMVFQSLPLARGRVWMCIILFLFASLSSSIFHTDLHQTAHTLHLVWSSFCRLQDLCSAFTAGSQRSGFELRSWSLPAFYVPSGVLMKELKSKCPGKRAHLLVTGYWFQHVRGWRAFRKCKN